MNTNYSPVVAGLLLYFCMVQTASSQVQFLNCPSSPVSLCLNDPDVELDEDNQFFLGENHPDATSCMVHLWHTTKVKVLCGDYVTYDVSIILAGDSTETFLATLGSAIDSNQEATLFLNTGNVEPNEITWNGLPYTPGCGVYHTLKWTARDTCGNETICTYPLEIYDCQKPTVDVISTPMVFNLNFSTFSLHIEDFIAGIRDDCQDSADVLYSLTPDSFVPFAQYHLCDFPAWNVPLDIDFWVADGGIDNNCNGTIEWSERSHDKYQFQIIVNDAQGTVDCDTIDYTASGNIRTYNNNAVGNVEVSLTGPSQPTQTQITGGDGNYLFYYGPHGGETLKITPRRNDNHKNGVSTLDMVKIQKHLLGTELFNNPYLEIAGDVNGSGALSAIDLIEIRKLILGLYPEFPNSPSWRFVRADYTFSDTFPPNYDPGTISFIDTEGLVNGDFIAIKIGDVNGTVDPGFQGSAEERSSRSIDWNVTNMEFQTGDIIEIPVSIPNPNEVIGFQFTVQHEDLEFLEITSSDIELSALNYALFVNRMTVSWDQGLHQSAGKSPITIILKARALKDGNLSGNLKINSAITEAEVYTSNEEVLRPILKIAAGPVFLDCKTEPVSLCIQKAGVRLPSNNQLFLGDLDPNATSCSVHVSRSTRVKSDCGGQLQYETFLFPADGSPAVLLKPMTQVSIDSAEEAELTFDSEFSVDSIIKRQGLSYTDACGSYHRIQWIVRDECGGVSICEEKIDLYDCASPSIMVNPGFNTITIPVGGMVTMFASSFITSAIDDCADPSTLIYSFSSKNHQPTYTITCDNVPALGVEIELPVWVADKGRDQNCDGNITWNERGIDSVKIRVVYIDNFGCPPIIEEIVVSGEVQTDNEEQVELVSVTLISPGHFFPTFITAENGEYEFSDLIIPVDIEIRAERNDNPKNGVTTLDLLKIKKHLFGMSPITNPYDLIAADINNSQSVSMIDIVEARKMVLDVYSAFPLNKSWRFVSKDYDFPNPYSPWPFKEYLEMEIDTSVTGLDFIGIKVGDVNNTAKANLNSVESRSALPITSLSTMPKTFKENEIIDIPFSISELNELSGFQFTLSSHDLEFINVSSGLLEISEEDYALFGSQMTMSWFDVDPKQVSHDDVLFTIKAIAKNSGSLQQSLSINSSLTEAEMYDANDGIYIPKLRIVDSGKPGLQLVATDPNPWSDQCVISFYNPSAGPVSLQLYDGSGRVEYEKERFFERGYQDFQVESKHVGSSGLKFFTITSEKESVSGKMIRMID